MEFGCRGDGSMHPIEFLMEPRKDDALFGHRFQDPASR